MASKQPAVYIMANAERGTLYVGVTGNLKRRVWEHREGLVEGFTKRYGVKRLVWYEFHPDFTEAIARETRIKRWNRTWKLELVESANAEWRDLWQELLKSKWIPAFAGVTTFREFRLSGRRSRRGGSPSCSRRENDKRSTGGQDHSRRP